MPLDTSGALLEGVRISEGNNPYSFPPRDLVSDWSAFSTVSSRAEYVLVTHSSDPAKMELEIADPTLSFRWTRNEPSVQRFSYDSFSKRWLPSPGGAPDVLGPLSNEERLVMPVPDPSVTSAPYAVYVGSPVRAVTFTVEIVGEAADFSPPASVPAGTVQVSSVDGKMNFSAVDVAAYGGSDVLSQRQGFLDRKSATGRFGVLPPSPGVDYFLFLNPRPASGQTPLVRIGYGRHLSAVQYAAESDLPTSPAAGTFAWAVDTGRVVFSPSDVGAHEGEGVYYDGVVISSVAPSRFSLASPPPAWPSVAFTVVLGAVGLVDARYVLFAEKDGVRMYWEMVPASAAPTKSPRPGTLVVRSDTGQAYVSPDDAADFSDWSWGLLDTVMAVEDGVSFQVFRSGVNGSGEPVVPDFTVLYAVENQVLVDGITQSPMVMLPTTPVVDPSLVYRVEQGPSSSGTFTGDLADGSDPSKAGMGYLLSLDSRQLRFSFRKEVSLTMAVTSPAVKLPDAAISELGLEAKIDGQVAEPGVDFGFDPVTGIVTFTEPNGQNDPDDASGVRGTVVLPVFIEPDAGLTSAEVGKWILVSSGPNSGARRITAVTFGRAAVAPDFVAPGPVLFDVRSSADVVVDRIWAAVDPPYKKFSLASGPSASGPFSVVPRSGFSVLASTSQINLTSPAEPGQAFLATYVGLLTDDDGATYTPTNLVELATFKVRQETATSVPGSPVVTFNPEGRPVSAVSGMKVYVNGVPLQDGYFEYQAPGTLRLTDPVAAGQKVVIDYFVEAALGGETSFNLRVAPMDLDSLQIAAGSDGFVANGDQTGRVGPGSVVWVGGAEAALVADSSYDPVSDVTTVTLSSPMASDSAGAQILSCEPLPESYYEVESSPVQSVISGSNSFVLSGDATLRYRGGTIVFLAGDPYHVSASEFLPASGATRVTLSSPARRSYALPDVERTVRPILPSGSLFQTSRSADLAEPFQLVRMGSSPAILAPGVDYTVIAGGVITLREPAVFGDELIAFYVAQAPLSAGTVLSFNYAHAVAPSQQNGLVGQRLVSDYVLYAPDTFYYRIETVLSFLPEVQDLLRSGAQSSCSSGPSTQSATGMANKDMGRPSLYYDEQHQGNLDAVTVRLLKFYNDLINLYEDYLSGLDGRVVGGSSGRFRFDGVLNNPPRASYAAVTNDIDDLVILYYRKRLAGFYSYQNVPVYGKMAFPNAVSRLFPTALTRSVALSDQVTSADRGESVGSLDLDRIQSVGTMMSTRSNQFFTSVSGNVYTVVQNGQEDLLVPPFAAGQEVDVYADDGSPDVSGTVVSVSGTGPFTVELDVPTALRRGSILRNVSEVPAIPDAGSNHFYQPGRDVGVDAENGQILNVTVGPPFLPDLGGSQARVWGNEIVDARVTFGNGDMAARRIPALDGGTLDDDGRVPAPRLLRESESSLLEDELSCIVGVGVGSSAVGSAKVAADGLTLTNVTVPFSVGDSIVFTSGLNSGLRRTVASALGASSLTVDSPLDEDVLSRPLASLSLVFSTIAVSPSASVRFLSGPNAGGVYLVPSSGPGFFRVAQLSHVDPGSNFEISVSGLVLTDVLARELGVLSLNAASAPVPPALVGRVASELSSLVAAVQYSGPVLASGTGTSSGASLSDPSVNFILSDVVAGSLVYLPGAGFGLYRVASVASHVLTLDVVGPFAPVPVIGPVAYQVIRPESFLRPAQWGPVSQAIRESYAFYSATVAWLGSISPSGAPARQATITVRRAQIEATLAAFEKVLVDGKLYETRYLWINQRVDRQDGNLVQQSQAAARRVKNLAKMLADQTKLLVADSI
jgi:hypothetical protein